MDRSHWWQSRPEADDDDRHSAGGASLGVAVALIVTGLVLLGAWALWAVVDGVTRLVGVL